MKVQAFYIECNILCVVSFTIDGAVSVLEQSKVVVDDDDDDDVGTDMMSMITKIKKRKSPIKTLSVKPLKLMKRMPRQESADSS